jgi:hypothetical protein
LDVVDPPLDESADEAFEVIRAINFQSAALSAA